MRNSWSKQSLAKLKNNPLNLPPLSDEIPFNNKKFKQRQGSQGIVNRSMKSEYASSSMPGFMTPSTMDSRQILMSKNYPLNINSKAVLKLRREVQRLMRKKVELMKDIKSVNIKPIKDCNNMLTKEKYDMMLPPFSDKIPIDYHFESTHKAPETTAIRIVRNQNPNFNIFKRKKNVGRFTYKSKIANLIL